MIDWYLVYDRDTYLKNFESIDFRVYNPLSLDSQDVVDIHSQVPFQSVFKNTNSMAQMISHFKHFIKEMSPLSSRVKDPFSVVCFEYLRKICLNIFNQLQNANLIIAENVDVNESNEANDVQRKMELDFRLKTMQLCYWSSSELFYIFTSLYLVTPNN